MLIYAGNIVEETRKEVPVNPGVACNLKILSFPTVTIVVLYDANEISFLTVP